MLAGAAPVRVAVSGASGFIGRHVLAELARCHAQVVATARDRRRLSASADTTVVEMDLAAPPANAFDLLGRPDVLIHLAWEGLPNYQSSRHAEVEGPRQFSFLSGLIEAGLPALVVTGTCLEYGMLSGALTEEMSATPGSPYAMAKDTLRRQLEGLRAAHEFKFTWARLFYVYGPGQASGSLLPQLAAAVARGDARFDMSGGEQVRDYVAVEEVARILVALALKRCDAGVLNVGSGRPVRIRDLVESWLAQHHWHIELNLGHYPYPEHEPMAFWGDVTRLNAALGSS